LRLTCKEFFFTFRVKEQALKASEIVQENEVQKIEEVEKPVEV